MPMTKMSIGGGMLLGRNTALGGGATSPGTKLGGASSVVPSPMTFSPTKMTKDLNGMVG